ALRALFSAGPPLRAVAADGTAFLLPASSDAEGRTVSLCAACGSWYEGDVPSGPGCGAATDVLVVARQGRRTGGGGGAGDRRPNKFAGTTARSPPSRTPR